MSTESQTQRGESAPRSDGAIAAGAPAAARPEFGAVSAPVAVGALLLAGILLQLFRSPDFTRNVVWAEDGFFLSAAYNDSFADAVTTPYGSYLHLVPRVLMQLIALLPVELAANAIAVCAAVFVVGLAVYVHHLSGAVFETRWARAAIAVAMVLAPASGYETNATIINLHWYLMFTAFWVLVAAPRSNRGIALGAVVVGMSVLSDPLTGVLLPLGLVGLLSLRSRRAVVIPAVLVVGAVIQFAVATSQQPLGDPAADAGALPAIYGLRVAGSLLVGEVFLDNFWRGLGYAFAFVALAALLALCAYGALRGDRRTRWFVGGCLVASFLLCAAPLMLRGTGGFLSEAAFTLNGSRYFLAPTLLLASALLKVIDFHVSSRRADIGPQMRWRTGQYVATLLALGLTLVNFSVVNVRNGGPFWRNGVDQARERCVVNARAGTEPGRVTVPVAPPVEPAPFSVVLPCERLR